MHIRLLLIASLLLPSILLGQLLPDPCAAKDLKHQRQGEAAVQRLSARIGRDNSATDQVAAIYDWITAHIRYDARAERKGKLLSDAPYATLKRGKALSGGYAALFQALCEASGIQATTVLGHTKGLDFRPGQRFLRGEHAWNAVQIDEKWQLLDVSWGAARAEIRPQRLRTKFYEMTGLPFIRRHRQDQHPIRDWLCVAPNAFIFTHLPIDPKWQLLDTAWILAGYESLSDSNFALVPQDYGAAIAASLGQSAEDQTIEEAENGKASNPKDDFDLAYAHARKGQCALYLGPEAGGDTIVWKKGMLDMQTATKHLADWKRRLGEEYRLRMSELRKLEIVAGNAMRHTRGEWKFVTQDKQKLSNSKYKGHRNDNAWHHFFKLTASRISYIASNRPPSTPMIRFSAKEKFDEKEQAFYVIAASRTDSLVKLCKAMHAEMAKIYVVSDSLERMREKIANGIAANTLLLMAEAESPYLNACDSLDIIARSNHARRKKHLRISQEFWRKWAVIEAKRNQTTQFFERIHDIVNTMYLKGLPIDSVNFKLAKVNYIFQAWSSKLEVYQEIPLMQNDLQTDHVNRSYDLIGTAFKTIVQQNKFLQRYVKRQKRLQSDEFQKEMRLANHVQQRATAGRSTLRAWVSEARRAARRAAQNKR